MTTPRTHSDLFIPRALAEWSAGTEPVVSVYVDWRVSGRGQHDEQTVVEKALHDAAATLPARTAARDSVDADRQRILEFLRERAEPGARGIAIFACFARGLWFVRSLAQPVATRVYVAEHPALVPLAEATQDAVSALVALVDTEHLRLIDLVRSGAQEQHGVAIDTWGAAHVGSGGGWGAPDHQRARETEIHRFAREVAEVIERALQASGSSRLVLCGDSTAVPPVEQALSPAARAALVATEQVEMRARPDEVIERVLPLVSAAARAAREAEVSDLIGRAAAAHNATAIPDEARSYVEQGRGDTLAIDLDAVDEAAAEHLIRAGMPRQTRIVLTRGFAPLVGAGGVAVAIR